MEFLKEIKDGFGLVWMRIDKAIDAVRNDKPANYEGSFIQKRDLIFLQKAREVIEG